MIGEYAGLLHVDRLTSSAARNFGRTQTEPYRFQQYHSCNFIFQCLPKIPVSCRVKWSITGEYLSVLLGPYS